MLLYKRLFKRFIAIAMILGYSFVAQAQQSTSLPTSFSDKEIGPTGQTIKHLVAVIPGEKTFEIDDEKLIIRANESDKLSRTNKEVSYLLAKLSDTEHGQIMLATSPDFPNIYQVIRIIVNGKELPQSAVLEFNNTILIKIAMAFPGMGQEKQSANWSPIEKGLNNDINPNLSVYTCIKCFQVSKSDDPCSNPSCKNPMSPMNGYLCSKCSHSQAKYKGGKCEQCGSYFLSTPKQVEQVTVVSMNNEAGATISPSLNRDLDPSIAVYTCPFCRKVSLSSEICSCPGDFMGQQHKPLPGYYCTGCEKTQQKFNSGKCVTCDRKLYFNE